MFEYSIGGKWLELLKEIAPHITRVAVLRELAVAAGPAQFSAAQTVAPSLSMELRNGGLLVTGSSATTSHGKLIIGLAAQYRLPAVYFTRFFVTAGGLISYGPDYVDQFRQAAGYVDRILKGEKPGDLPVQAPTKYELVVNIKTAKELGLTIPPAVLARADALIE